MKKLVSMSVAGALAFALAVPAFAEESGEMQSSSSSVSSMEGRMMMKKDKKEMKGGATVDSACMQTAVDKRDTAIMAAVDAYAVSVKTALTTRKDALKAAWALTDKAQRETASKAAWTAFSGTWKKASQSTKAARKAAWATFKTDAKACGQTGAEASGESTDGQI